MKRSNATYYALWLDTTHNANTGVSTSLSWESSK